MKFLVRTAFVAFLWTTIMWAQATTQITGTVHDPSGGSIPGASVRVTQTDTGFTSSMVTNADGDPTQLILLAASGGTLGRIMQFALKFAF